MGEEDGGGMKVKEENKVDVILTVTKCFSLNITRNKAMTADITERV